MTDNGIADATLVGLIDKCTEHKPNDRPNVFDLIEELKKTMNTLLLEKPIIPYDLIDF
jgi:hypothetical protein